MNDGKKRLALFIPTLHGGGAERVMLNLALGLVERGWPVDLVVAKAEGEFLAEVPNGVRIVDLKSGRIRKCLPKLYKYLRDVKPHALLAAMGHANVAALLMRALARSNTRIIVSVHASISQTSWSNHPVKKWLFPLANGYFYPWSDAIVTVSEGAADDLSRIAKLPRESIRVIYNPVVMPGLIEQAREELDHPWFASGAPPVVLGVGRLTPQKDFVNLIRAFHTLRKSFSARLMILGEGPERADLERLISELGLDKEVLLAGYVNNPYRYMARAAMFVLSSGWEALPTVLIEAMALGTPVVATDCPSGPREILVNGRYGQLVPVGDDQALARSMLNILSESGSCENVPHERIYRANEFSLARAVDDYLDVLVTPSCLEEGV